MPNKNNILNTYETEIYGQKVLVTKVKPKTKKKGVYNSDYYSNSIFVNLCPSCLSRTIVDESGILHCSGDRLKVWEIEFIKFRKLNDLEKSKYIKNLSNYGRFLDLYERWEYAYSSNGKEVFNCGFTNTLFPLHSNSSMRIPDPCFVKILEQQLGRNLKEEELYEEEELFFYAGKVITKYRKGAKVIRIPWVILPSEQTVYLAKQKQNKENE